MRERVEQYVLQHELISPGDKVLIGLSGGGDSVALLHILKSLCARLDFTICAAHLNHGIRGEAAHEDAEFAAPLAEALRGCRFRVADLCGRVREVPACCQIADDLCALLGEQEI